MSRFAAYISGERVVEVSREGEVKTHDFTRRPGILDTGIALPAGAPEWARNTSRLWTEVGLAERRKDSLMAREVLIATPHQMPPDERKRFIAEHAQWLADRYRTPVQYGLHKPTRRQDPRNYHAHLLMPSRELTAEGFGRKLSELELGGGGRKHVEAIREHVAGVINAALARARIPERVDHRSERRQRSGIRSKMAALRDLFARGKERTMSDDGKAPARKKGWSEQLKELQLRMQQKDRTREIERPPPRRAPPERKEPERGR